MPKARASQSAVAGFTSSQLPLRARLRLENAGKWLAWAEDLSRLIASGEDPAAVHLAARDAGEVRAIYEWVPPLPVRQVDSNA